MTLVYAMVCYGFTVRPEVDRNPRATNWTMVIGCFCCPSPFKFAEENIDSVALGEDYLNQRPQCGF